MTLWEEQRSLEQHAGARPLGDGTLLLLGDGWNIQEPTALVVAIAGPLFGAGPYQHPCTYGIIWMNMVE